MWVLIMQEEWSLIWTYLVLLTLQRLFHSTEGERRQVIDGSCVVEFR